VVKTVLTTLLSDGLNSLGNLDKYIKVNLSKWHLYLSRSATLVLLLIKMP